MKDLDFDELDRAVNSLIGSPASTNGTPVASPTVVDTPAVVSPQPLATRRSSGRFMDVVHPSSDMRSATVPPRPIVREGMTIQPIANTSAEVPVAPQEPVIPKTPDWPDPLDFNGYKTEKATDSEVPEQDMAQDKTDDTPVPATEPVPPLESPFLPDAKVEKRPLGAFTDTTSVPDASAVEPSEQSPSEDSDRPINTDTPLPAELQDDLLSIESNEDTAEVITNSEPSVEPKVQEAAVGTMSIPQQYVEQPSTGDKPAGSIFDIDAYRKPAVHSKKTKSGWMVVMWIVLLLILGAGAGAAFYFYLLPLL